MRQHRLQSPIVPERERAPTPDPFANSPVDDEDDTELGGPLRPQVKSPAPPPPLPSSRSITFSTKSRTSVQTGYDLDDDTSSQLPGEVSMSRSVGKLGVGISQSDVRGSRRDDDIEESQLFPGSDLF